MPYLLSDHARQRIEERNITPESMAEALNDECALRRDLLLGTTIWYRRRVAVVTDEAKGSIVTAFRVGRSWPKRMFGR